MKRLTKPNRAACMIALATILTLTATAFVAAIYGAMK